MTFILIEVVASVALAALIQLVLRHACSPRQTYTGRHHLAGGLR